MKKAILSILFVAGFIICASYHWLAMIAYLIILLACTIFIIDIDAWQDKKRNKAMLLAVGNYIIDIFLDDMRPHDIEDIENSFLDSTLYDDDGVFYVVESQDDENFDMQLVADSINDLIKHGILRVVYTERGLQIGYID